MRVLITGGTGYLGEPVLKTLLEQGHELRALVREPGRLKVAGVEAVVGDVLEPATLTSAAQDCQACVHMVGILREDPDRGITFDRLNYRATMNMLAACLQAEVRRFVYVSANGAERALPFPYYVSKARAEVAVDASPLETVILRPSIVYGGAGSEEKNSFIGMLESVFSWAPAVPYWSGDGYGLAPVSAHEVALAVGASLVKREAVGQAYHLCGNEEMSYRDLLKLVRDLGGHKAFLFPLPFKVGQVMSKIKGFPATTDMLEMLRAGNTLPPEAADFHTALDVPAESFKEWLLQRRGGQDALEHDPAEALPRARPTRELYIPRIEDFPPGELPGSGENLS